MHVSNSFFQQCLTVSVLRTEMKSKDKLWLHVGCMVSAITKYFNPCLKNARLVTEMSTRRITYWWNWFAYLFISWIISTDQFTPRYCADDVTWFLHHPSLLKCTEWPRFRGLSSQRICKLDSRIRSSAFARGAVCRCSGYQDQPEQSWLVHGCPNAELPWQWWWWPW